MTLISQTQFESLKNLLKQFKEQDSAVFLEGQKDCITRWTKEIVSQDKGEVFLIDYFRPKLEISQTKITFQTRYRNSIKLIRLDLSGTHTNPEEFGGKTFEGPHIHIYNEIFHDKIAYQVSEIGITDQEIQNFDIYKILKRFLDYFNTKYPLFTPVLEF